MSWECSLCGKKNPDSKDLCVRNYKREACSGFRKDFSSDRVKKYLGLMFLIENKAL